MTFFRELADNPIAWIFTLISLAYFVSGLRLAWELWQRRDKFTEGALQPWKKQWAERAAFLLAVPPGVFIHELFHAFAVWAFNGRVHDVGYGFFWGYVSHSGQYSAAQQWFISLAGTLGTLLFGFALWFVLRHNHSQAWRYFGLRALRFHLYYGLLYYPLFTLFTFIGDWRTIYNFDATPLLSSLTLATHVAALGAFWWSDRRGSYEMPAFQSGEEAAEMAALREQAQQQPDNERLQMQLIEALRRRGATAEAKAELRRFLKQNPRSAEAHLMMALLESGNRQEVSRKSRRYIEDALQMGLRDRTNLAVANMLLAQYYLQVERWDEALRRLDQGLGAADETVPSANRAHLHYLRALVQRRRGQYHSAAQEIAQAIQLAQAAGNEPLAARYRQEQELIAHHGS